jgi:subtilisin family serine protease
MSPLSLFVAVLGLLSSSEFVHAKYQYQAQPLHIPKKGEASARSVGSTNGRYIIKLKSKASVQAATHYLATQEAKASSAKIASLKNPASPAAYGVRYAYGSKVLNGVTAMLTKKDLADFKQAHKEDIEYIEPDRQAFATALQHDAPNWGQVRVGYWKNALEETRDFPFPNNAGAGVDVYILDTGLQTNHASFQGRAKLLRNFVREENAEDRNGHGTHVAGTIGSALYGIAKKANIYGLKVLSTEGSGLYSRIIAAIDYVVQHAKPGRTVINLSLAGEYSEALNDAMKNARKAGVVVVVAAGNESQDACKLSPASSKYVVTVGASDPEDNVADFSNWGKCVDIFAPGVDIVSLDPKYNDKKAVMSGTSMASPHVAGITAVYMSVKKYRNAEEVIKDVLGWARRCVKGSLRGSGNGMAYLNAKLRN